MSSIGSILSIARTAITAHQTALQTVSHNIANAEVDGYSRQRVALSASVPVLFPYGSIGTGVSIDNITRMRQPILDDNYHREVGSSEGYAVRRDLLAEIEQVFGEPSANGLTASLDALWNAWSDLSNNPGSPIAQNAVRQRGGHVTQTLNAFDTRLNEIGAGARGRLVTAIDELNQLSGQVADLNVRILAAEAGGNEAPDLRDARDRVADQMAKLAGTRAIVNADGTMAVLLGGTTLVDQANVRPLELQSGNPAAIGIVGRAEPLPAMEGAFGALLGVINSDIPSARARLDTLARGLVNGTNYYHQFGWTAAGDALGNANWNPLNGPTGSKVNFFDAAGVTAATISLSAEVKADAGVIASGATQNAAGDNSIALKIAAMRDGAGLSALSAAMGAVSFGAQVGLATGESFNDHYRMTVTDVGLDLRASTADAEIHATLAQQAQTRRESVSGVSIDEELTLLMRHQQAFTAASRIARVADEMAQSILEMV